MLVAFPGRCSALAGVSGRRGLRHGTVCVRPGDPRLFETAPTESEAGGVPNVENGFTELSG